MAISPLILALVGLNLFSVVPTLSQGYGYGRYGDDGGLISRESKIKNRGGNAWGYDSGAVTSGGDDVWGGSNEWEGPQPSYGISSAPYVNIGAQYPAADYSPTIPSQSSYGWPKKAPAYTTAVGVGKNPDGGGSESTGEVAVTDVASAMGVNENANPLQTQPSKQDCDTTGKMTFTGSGAQSSQLPSTTDSPLPALPRTDSIMVDLAPPAGGGPPAL